MRSTAKTRLASTTSSFSARAEVRCLHHCLFAWSEALKSLTRDLWLHQSGKVRIASWRQLQEATCSRALLSPPLRC